MKLQNLAAVALVLGLCLCLPQPLLAWDATGHQLVAAIAWDNMTAPARQKAFEILNAASDDTCLPELFSNDSRPLAERQREFFMKAATWPDLIRDNACESLSQPDWHFTDHFWQGTSGATGADAPADRNDLHGKPQNAVERLGVFRPIVACAHKPCADADDRAMDLAWTLHLVGDIHQPLHSAAHVTKPKPKGDKGGNSFLLGSTGLSPLHTYWDHIVDTSMPRKTSETAGIYLKRVESAIVHDHPAASMTAQLESGNFDAWSQEGFKTAKRALYPASLHQKQEPSTDYLKMGFRIADEAIALGGYRLADLLNKDLGH
jgi:hypothetical protein